MTYTTKEIGQIVKYHRKGLDMTQKDLALVSGVGVRFISDLENGKESCQLGKSLAVINSLGIQI